MSRAKTEFGAKEKELEKLEFMTRTNPMNPKGPPMRLFLRKDVRRLMAKKYGGEDKLNRVVKARLAKEQEKPAASIFPTSQKASFIKFCSARGASYGCFSTFSMHPFTMGGKQWPTVEHYVQGQKFAGEATTNPIMGMSLITPFLQTGLPMEELIRKTPDPLRAKKIGEVKGIPPRSDWKDKQEEIMYEANLAKFTEHKEIQKTLLDTGFAEIVYHSRADFFWGDGGDGSGENRLGKILALIRGKLRREAEGINERKRSRAHSEQQEGAKKLKKRRREDNDDEGDESEQKGKAKGHTLAEWDICDIL